MNFLLIIWCLAAGYLLLHYLFFHLRLALYRPKPSKPFDGGVSVVICAKNEAGNLRKNLPLIMAQKNVNFEVVVVNDQSTDSTLKVLRSLSTQYPNLKVVDHTPENTNPGKKQALLLGLQTADHDHFVLTDADCAPIGDQWLSSMAGQLAARDLVLGVGPYRYHSSLTGQLVQWETLLTAQNYLSFALTGLPYQGVGRNLAYSRRLLESSSQFEEHKHLASGDDDLFVAEVGTARNTALNIDQQAYCWSDGPIELRSWWRQKRRHLSTSTSYKPLPMMLLGAFGLAQLTFYTLLIPMLIYLLLVQSEWTELFLILMALKFVIQAIGVRSSLKRQFGQFKLWTFPVWEGVTVVFLAIIHFQNFLQGSPRRWN